MNHWGHGCAFFWGGGGEEVRLNENKMGLTGHLDAFNQTSIALLR